MVAVTLDFFSPVEVSYGILLDLLRDSLAFFVVKKQSRYTPWRRLGGEEV
jgi:hypothetical protein